MLINDPGTFFMLLLYRVPALVFSLCCHEWAHAYVANRCGDPTARLMGRMTLNPLRHLDPLGAIMMMTVGFGWAKPVPVNPNNYRNRIADDVKVSLAGIATNLVLFLLFTAAAVGLNGLLWRADIIAMYGPRLFLSYGGLNLSLVLAGPELGMFMRTPALAPVVAFVTVAAQMNLSLAIFNLLPIPPLDGYHVFNDLLLRGRMNLTPQVAQMGMLVLLVLSFSTNIIGDVMSFLAGHVQSGVLTVFLKMTGAQ